MKSKKQNVTEEEAGYQSFVKISKGDSDEFMELPREKDGTVLLSTVQAQYPSAIGLKYKSSSGGWRGIRAENNVLDPPFGGWGEDVYIITESDALKRRASEDSSVHKRKSSKTSKLLEDMIVLGLPYATTEDELNEYFTDSCGELAFCELKLDRNTQKSRGFGFIRFQHEDAAKEALKGHHEIGGRKLNVRLSKKQDEVSMKLFVGRLASGTTKEDVEEYFSEFGDMIDIFVPNPFRGFGFVTYSSQEDAMRVLRMSHSIKGARLNVKAAEERLDPGKAQNVGNTNTNTSFGQNMSSNSSYGQNSGYSTQNPQFGQNTGYGGNFQQKHEPVQKDTVSELKDMLVTLINSRK